MEVLAARIPGFVLKTVCGQLLLMEHLTGLLNGDIMGEEIVIDEEFTEKTSDWGQADVGKRIPKRVTPNGTYFNEIVVQVFCQFCGSEFVGPAREAGGFLGGHECLHAWEVSQAIGREDGLVE